MTCGELRAKLISLLKQRPEISGELDTDKGDLHELESEGGNQATINHLRAEITRLQTALSRIDAEISDARNQIEAQCIVKQPQQILALEFENPVPPADFSATTIAGGVFPSSGAKQEWKQVLEPHEEDFEDSNLVGATGWVLNPEFSDIDFPFHHPFGFDYEFMLALDQPSDNPTKYTFLLARGNQSGEGGTEAVTQAEELQIQIPRGPDNEKSLLGVEIDRHLIPQQFSDRALGLVEGDRIAVVGRWIVDCGHEVKVADLVDSFRAEIHPPLIMAAAKATTGSLLNLGAPNSPDVTRVIVTSRPFLVSQRFTTNTETISDDTAPDDGPFFDHMKNEIEKVIFLQSLKVEAHPKIKRKPFRGSYGLHLIVRPPSRSGGGPGGGPHPPLGPLQVSFHFIVRSGCTVQVTARPPDAIDIFIALNSDEYIPPSLPNRHEHSWTRSELDRLHDGANRQILEIEAFATALSAALGGGGGVLVAEVAAVLERGITGDEYDRVADVDIFDTSAAVTISADGLPTPQGVTRNDNQPFPIFGWLEVSHGELVNA
jgi:hypothetical protein